MYVVSQICSDHPCAVLSNNLESSWWLLDSIPWHKLMQIPFLDTNWWSVFCRLL